MRVALEGNLKTINELDPEKDKIDVENLTQFIKNFNDNSDDGPEYLVIDNFIQFSGLNKVDLLEARKEAEKMSEAGCAADQSGHKNDRCDSLIWLKGLFVEPGRNPYLNLIQTSMLAFGREINILS